MLDQVSEIMDAETTCNLINRVDKFLSQFRIALHVKWHVTCSVGRFHSTNDVKDLYYDVTAPEGFCFKFTPTPKGLHVRELNKNTVGRF